ncbi:MAG TPA: M48 family metallopeptidase [Thermoplasmata archaeon]|jgi:STE24 endopeptidase|nr:M48 family metallopeptidase [Thermoplasmata archaeon]
MEVLSAARDARLSALGFDVDRQRLAREYKRKRVALTAIRILVYIVLSAWLLTGLTFSVKAWASAFGAGFPQYALYAVILYFLYWIPVIPLALVGGFFLERRYGVSVQGFHSWLKDAAKGLAIGLGFSVLAVEILYALLAAAPERWWLYAWLLGLAVGAALAWLGPVVIAPWFYKFEPVADEALEARLCALAERSSTKVVGVYRMVASPKTTRAFGGLAGIGNTRRIILSDTLLNRYTPDEVETVIAHELGHHVHRDSLRLAAAGALGSLLGLLAVDRILDAAVPALRLGGPADIAGLPLIGLTIATVSTVVAPILNALSRRWEAAADLFAIRMTGNQSAFASTMVKIHDQNLGDADPHPLAEFLFHDHPSGRRRVEAALQWRV